MPSTDNRKNTNNGLLCGLRNDPVSDDEVYKDENRHSAEKQTKQQHTNCDGQTRPQPLTLPFENRERASHLITEEELDYIIRREHLDHPLPQLPTEQSRGLLGVSVQRSLSSARHSRSGPGCPRPRPASADVSRLLTGCGARNALDAPNLPRAPRRNPTLTALPNPPTANDLLAYPAPPVGDPTKSEAQITFKPAGWKNKHIDVHDQAPHNIQPVPSDDTPALRSHKRHFSAAGLLESVKKRMKQEERSQIRVENGDTASDGMDRTEGQTDEQGHRSSPDKQYERPKSRCSTDMLRGRSSPFQTNDSLDLKKSLLHRTWSKTKHAARLSISTIAPASRSTTPCTPPKHVDSSGGRTTPAHSTLTRMTSKSSHYDTSAEPSPVTSSRPPTPMSCAMDSSYEFISGPLPKKSIMTRVGVPSRAQLNTVVSRQQSRIVDLTLQNNVLVNQVEILRGQVEGLKMQSVPVQERRIHQCSEGCHHAFSTERPIYTNADILKASRDTSRIAREDSYDPRGWRRIVGVHDGDDADTEMSNDDKRKTWMTCDS